MTAARAVAFLWVSAPPCRIKPLIDELLQAFDDFCEKPARMLLSPRPGKMARYDQGRLVASARSAGTTSILVKGDGEARVGIDLDLRDNPMFESRFIRRRHARFVSPVVAPDDGRLLRFLQVACTEYPVAHGAILRASSYDKALDESGLGGGNHIGTPEERRLHFDGMNAPEALHLLRRLYPVTIIGPEIWAKLPPLPAVDPPLVVRDLADCKMVTAWPTLVEPHDLQFLLGTRALRRWLWPHTIQNPADDPDEIDVRLQWAGLLPW